jgi:hypothetical protein
MKVTKSQLKQLIKEEIEAVLEDFDSAGWPSVPPEHPKGSSGICIQHTRSGTKKLYKGDEGYEKCVAEKKMQETSLEEKDDWIQKAVDPDHEGDCTPMTKSTCTPKRKALAKRFKKAAKKKEKKGGTGWQGKV